MAEFDNMRKSLPVAYRTDKWVCDLLAAIQSLDDTQREQMLDITQQLFPGSMTWALAIEERDAGLPSTGTLEERRTALIARWRGSGKCDVDLIQRVCDSWKNGEISVGFAKGRRSADVCRRVWHSRTGRACRIAGGGRPRDPVPSGKQISLALDSRPRDRGHDAGRIADAQN